MRLLAHDALSVALNVYDRVLAISDQIRRGETALAKVAFAELDSVVMRERPVLVGVIRSQVEAAQGLDFPQGVLSRPLVVSRQPAEQPDAANENHPDSSNETAPIGTGL